MGFVLLFATKVECITEHLGLLYLILEAVATGRQWERKSNLEFFSLLKLELLRCHFSYDSIIFLLA